MVSWQGLICLPVIFQIGELHVYYAANVTVAFFQWQYKKKDFEWIFAEWHISASALGIEAAIVLDFSYRYRKGNACVQNTPV